MRRQMLESMAFRLQGRADEGTIPGRLARSR